MARVREVSVLAGDMYLTYFGLSDRPFSLTPDPDFLYWGDGHRAAFTVLEYGIVTRAPITVLTGEIGAGKTTLLQRLLDTLDENATVGLISNAQGGRGELLRWVCSALGIEAPADTDYVGLYQRFQDYLIEEYATGRFVTLVIDEAQNLSVEALEELRMYTNINSGRDELLQLILVGQPQLREKIIRPELQQFAQRIVAAYHLMPLDAEATAEYIAHRLAHAGATEPIFTEGAVEQIARHTQGIPRLVNKMCEFCLVYGAINEEKPITEETVSQVIADGVFVSGFIQTGRAAE
ncbi:MAG: AAA family ATPase [Pseudomonadota bacterium]